MHATQDNKCADLEDTCEALDFLLNVSGELIVAIECFQRNEQFCRNLIAPSFDVVLGNVRNSHIRECRLAEPKVRKFMRKGEHLRRLCVGAVNEDKRREAVAEGKAAEFIGVELAGIVAADHAANNS